MPFRSSLVILALSADVIFQTSAQNISVNVPASVPGDASSRVPAEFPALAFEESSFVPYSTYANNTPNTFSQGLIKSIYSRTGGQPILRVGGTSGDYVVFNQSQTTPAEPPATLGRPPAFRSLTIGPSLYELCKNIPGASYVINVPLANYQLSNCIDTAKAAWNAVGKDIYAFEIGNEPSLYEWGPDKKMPSQQNLTTTLKDFKAALLSNITEVPSGPFFQEPDTDSGHPSSYPPQDMIPGGLNDDNSLKVYSMHYYQEPITNISLYPKALMSHSKIADKLDVFRPQIEFLDKYSANRSTPIPFALTEVGNTLGGGDEDPHFEERNNLGTALWQADFQLYAMAIGIKRIHWQQIMRAGYQFWLPVESNGTAPVVRANYYAQPFIADFIGKGNETRVAHLPLNQTSGNETDLQAYAAYDSGVVKRVTLVNFEYWTNKTMDDPSGANAVASADRPVKHVTLDVPQNSTKACLKKLTAPEGALANDTLTWDGVKWSYPTGLDEKVGDGDMDLKVDGGKVEVAIAASEAVMICFA